ncbi:VOC family protein [Oryzifoliimicrobium ureilyticus]|uniref:VOC family protein n=1 Tax=Oryzifoliimicrobium ureilyticus TaxID=3113724 RepID=UPI0030767A53
MLSPNLILLYVRDPLASAEFYGKIFGSEPVAVSENFIAFSFDNGVTLGLWRQSKVVPQPSAIGYRGEVAFMVPGSEGVEARYREWQSLGLPFAQELTRMDFGPTFVVLDPDGHRLRVCEPET